MDRLNLQADIRGILGKKVRLLRKDGLLPAHVFGKNIETEHVSVNTKEFLRLYESAGETGLIDLKIGDGNIRPVLIRDVQYDPVTGNPLHIDFYQVNLLEKVTVKVPIELIGDEPEKVHLGEAIVLQTLNEVEVEALPTDLIEKLEVDISVLKEIDDVITVGKLNYDRSKLAISADEEEVVVKLAPAVSAEMEALLEEQAAEAAAAEEAVVPEGEKGIEEAKEEGKEEVLVEEEKEGEQGSVEEEKKPEQ